MGEGTDGDLGNWVVSGDNMDVLPKLPDGRFRLIYLDPPFNSGGTQRLRTLRTTAQLTGDRSGFQGRRYRTTQLGSTAFADTFDDYLGFLSPRLEQARRLLAKDGTLYFHIDYREVHYCKLLLDSIFGRGCFVNEIIWAYDFGGRSKKRWPAKHDTILVYSRHPGKNMFDTEAMAGVALREPGMASVRRPRGATVSDVWWHTIVGTNSRERTGYATQKPEELLRRIILVSSRKGDQVLDLFAGSGTTGGAASKLDRRFMLIDSNPQAIEVMRKRLGDQATFISASEWRAGETSPPALVGSK